MAIETDLFDLTGKVALLTGASKGMGLAMAEALAEHGARVVISSRKLDRCELAAGRINERCGDGAAIAVACNIGHKDQLENLVRVTRDELGPIDILVCNAGINPFYGSMADIPDWAFDKILASNVRSNHWLCQMVAPDMAEKGAGSIIITSSTGAFAASDVLGTYGISKIAELGLMRNLALELGPKGIRVNAVCPGTIKTDFARVLWETEEAAQGVIAGTPLRKIGEPDDLKGVAVFLASGASGHMTGQALTVCGGMFMWR